MPLPVNTPSVNTVTRRAIKRVVKQKTGKEPMSSLAVGCLTGDLYDFHNSVTLLITIKQASQQTFENDQKRLVELLKCMNLITMKVDHGKDGIGMSCWLSWLMGI